MNGHARLNGSAPVALLAAVAVVCAATWMSGRAAGAAADARPNLVLITVDTLRADRVGAYGDRTAETPNIDALARRGVRFDAAFAHAPLTFPSHTSILTGELPSVHGARDNGWEVLQPRAVTVADRLRSAGYHTGAFVSTFILSAQFGLDHGFDVYDDHLRSAGPLLDLDLRRPAADTAAAAERWIAAQGSAPFFAWIHFYDPHAPLKPSPGGHNPYDAAVTEADAGVGRILAALDRAGVARRTAVILTGDHGEGLGDHGEEQHGLLLYDSVVRVPLIVAAPGLASGVVANQVQHVDIVPTLLALAGAPAASGLPGHDLLTAARHAASAGHAAQGDETYGESWYGRIHFGWSELRYLRADGWKYIDGPAPELYDVLHDPGESKNVAESHAQLAGAMRARLVTLARSDSPATETRRVAPDAETAARLAALGYVSGTSAPTRTSGESTRPDPKRMLPAFEAYEGALNDGIGQLVANQPARAVEKFRKLVHDYPQSFGAHHYLGYALTAAHHDAEAIPEYQEALRINPQYAIADFDLARAEAAVGQTAQASAAIDAGFRLEPQSVYGAMAGGLVAWARGDNAGARRLFQFATTLAPQEPRTFANLGEACMRTGDLACARGAFTRLVQLDYAPAAAHYNLGVIAERSGTVEEAEREYREALTEDAGLEAARAALRRLRR